MSKWVEDSIKIRGEDIPIKTGYLDVVDLKFFVENPRIYSVVWSEGDAPDQDEIYERLRKYDHVKELMHDIELNGGLIEPVIVHDKTFEVLEGNRRLAAYRMLCEKDSVKWGKIKASLLPETVSEESIFALLGQFHIKGRADWAPYEQAGFLYRRFKRHAVTKAQLAKEIGLSSARVGKLIATYELMQKHDVRDVNKWSYFEVYNASPGIRKVSEKFPEIEKRFVNDVKTGKIKQAVDVREKMGKLDRATTKTQKSYVDGNINLNQAYERAVRSGGTNNIYARFKKFRDWIIEPDVLMEAGDVDPAAAKKINFEITKIEKRLKQILKKLPKS